MSGPPESNPKATSADKTASRVSWPESLKLPIGSSKTKGRVLVVDDEPLLLRAFDRVLSRAGYEVVTAADGQAASRLVIDSEFDAIVSDIAMPGMNGIQLLRAAREHDLDVPVLLITGA